MSNHSTQSTHTTAPNRQTLYVAIALVAGILLGELLNLTLGSSDAAQAQALFKQIIEIFTVLTDIFLRMIKMIIAPLVFSTL